MKVTRLCFVLFCVYALLVEMPDESEAGVPIGWFIGVALKVGKRYLEKNTYYARCNTRNVPRGISCPSIVFGVGLSRNQAQSSAKLFATTFGDSRCGKYVGHCQINKWGGGKTKVN